MHTVDHTTNLIELKNVSFGFTAHDTVIRDVTLAVHRGDYLGIIGPNGGGKTTLLKVMLGLLKPTKGTVRLFGKDISKFHQWSKIGYVPQKASAFDPNFPVTVEEVVAMGTYARRGLFHRTTRADRSKVHQALEHVDMLEYRHRLAGDLSGGQQQRIFIARALAGDPEIILLDEPTVGVDVSTQEQFYHLLKKLNHELDLTLVLVSHELEVVARETTEIASINNTLVYYRTPEELAKSGGLELAYGKSLKHVRATHHKHA